jgi:hypothetical protein
MRKLARSITRSLYAGICGTVSLALLLSAMAVLPPRVEAQPRGYQLQLANRSSYGIHQLNLSPSDDENWGPNQLSGRTLQPGGTFTLSAIPAGEYDIRIVDEDQDACEVQNVSIARNASVVITDELLLGCQQAAAGTGVHQTRPQVRPAY